MISRRGQNVAEWEHVYKLQMLCTLLSVDHAPETCWFFIPLSDSFLFDASIPKWVPASVFTHGRWTFVPHNAGDRKGVQSFSASVWDLGTSYCIYMHRFFLNSLVLFRYHSKQCRLQHNRVCEKRPGQIKQWRNFPRFILASLGIGVDSSWVGREAWWPVCFSNGWMNTFGTIRSFL